MQRATLGSTGYSATRIGLGTMPLAIQGRPAESDAVRVIHRALDAGINWLDTADAYCLDDADTGYGERLIARALREWGGDRDRVMVATKGGCMRPKGGWTVDGKPARLKTACERSLQALGVSSIFLYQLHAPDSATPFLDSVGALADLQREGKIRHVGLSNVDVGFIKEAQRVATIASVQNRHNAFDRGNFTSGVIDYCMRQHIAFIPHSVFGGHTGHTRADESAPVVNVGKRRNLTPHQVVLLWMLETTPEVFPIPGAKRLESLESTLAAMDQRLEPEDMKELASAFPREPITKTIAVRAKSEAKRIARQVRRVVGRGGRSR
ncbi:MAG TPA: aldo/keto reductase [Polyangiaceae bacterium]|jgi:aryl-alcohol dehydrogenase-like predicted oxidoreductase|nr:aldo/keto reductase [Polyangiaceae bacterium]